MPTLREPLAKRERDEVHGQPARSLGESCTIPPGIDRRVAQGIVLRRDAAGVRDVWGSALVAGDHRADLSPATLRAQLATASGPRPRPGEALPDYLERLRLLVPGVFRDG